MKYPTLAERAHVMEVLGLLIEQDYGMALNWILENTVPVIDETKDGSYRELRQATMFNFYVSFAGTHEGYMVDSMPCYSRSVSSTLIYDEVPDEWLEIMPLTDLFRTS